MSETNSNLSGVPEIRVTDFDMAQQPQQFRTNVQVSTTPTTPCRGRQLFYRCSTKVIHGIEFTCGKWGQLVANYPWTSIFVSLALAIACGGGLYSLQFELRPYKLWIKEPSEFIDVLEWKMQKFPNHIRKHIAIWEMPNILNAKSIKQMWELHKRAEAILTSETNTKYSDVCVKVPSLVSPDVVDYSYDYTLEEDSTQPMPAWLSPISKRSADYDDYYDSVPQENATKSAKNSLPSWLSSETDNSHSANTYANKEDASKVERQEHCEFVSNLQMVCYEESLLEVWGYNETIINELTDAKVLADINRSMSSQVTGFPYNVSSYLGEIKRDSHGKILGARGALQVWYTNVDMEEIRSCEKTGCKVVIDVGSGEQVDEGSMEWEQELNAMVDASKLEGMPVNLQASYLFGSVHRRALFQDFVWVCTGWGVMMLYVVITLGRPFTAKSRIVPAVIGIVCVGLSVLASYGICTLCGIPYGPLNSVLPVLLIALGVDDMYVILNAWDTVNDAHPILDIKTRTMKSMHKAGLAITVTSLTDVIAFVIGATTEVPALRYFCVYAAVGIAMVYILQITLFLASVVLHQNKIDRQKHCLPCSQGQQKSNSKQKSDWPGKILYWWSKFLLNPIFATSILIVSGVTIGASVCQVLELEQRFESVWLLPKSSDIYKWFTTMDEIFPKDGREGSVYFEGSQLPEDLPQLQELSQRLSQLPSVSRVDAWYDRLVEFIEENDALNSKPLDHDTFMSALSYFLFSEQGARFRNDIVFKNPDQLQCTELAPEFSVFKINFRYFRLEHDGARTQQAMRDVRRTVSESNVTGYAAPWALSYGQWETDAIISIELLRNVIVVLLIVFGMTMILLASLRGAVLVVASVMATLVDVAGLMHLWGLTINTVSCISLVIAIGICVDYAAHITHGFLVSRGTNHERMTAALKHMGPAVLHGGISTLLAFVMLSPSDTFVFISYFKILTLVALFGLFHALVLLPILLSLVGPPPYPDRLPEDGQSWTTETTHYPGTPKVITPNDTPDSSTPNSPNSNRALEDAPRPSQVTHVDGQRNSYLATPNMHTLSVKEQHGVHKEGLFGSQAMRNVVGSRPSGFKDNKEDLSKHTVFIDNTIPIKDNENTVTIYVRNT